MWLVHGFVHGARSSSAFARLVGDFHQARRRRRRGPGVSAAAQPWEARAAHAGPAAARVTRSTGLIRYTDRPAAQVPVTCSQQLAMATHTAR